MLKHNKFYISDRIFQKQVGKTFNASFFDRNNFNN